MFDVPAISDKGLIVRHVISITNVSTSINLLSRPTRCGGLAMLVAAPRFGERRGARGAIIGLGHQCHRQQRVAQKEWGNETF
jgi:hypothetical protein